MRHWRWVSFSVVAAVLLVAAQSTAQQKSTTLVVSRATVVDPTRAAALADAVVVVEGNRIARIGSASQVAIPAGATVIDGRGKYVIPGLADMHQHLGDGYKNDLHEADKNLRRMLAFGFTTIFSTGHATGYTLPFADLKKRATDDAPMPRFFGVGGFITVTGGHASQPAFNGAMIADTPEDGRRAVRSNKASGADAIKFIYDDMARPGRAAMPKMRPEVMQAIIDESHKQGLKVYVHATAVSGAKEVLRNGADGLVHALPRGAVDDELLGLMKARNAVYITTHALYNALHDPPAWARRLEAMDDRHVIPAEVYENLKQAPVLPESRETVVAQLRANLKKVHDAGVLVVAGTDTTVNGVLLGLSSQAELMLLVEDGLTPREALQAASLNAAKMLGREKLQGSLEAGKLADMVILDADPLADMRNVR